MMKVSMCFANNSDAVVVVVVFHCVFSLSIILFDCSNSLNQRMLFKRWCTWLKRKIVIVMFQMDLLLNFTLFNAIGCIFTVYSIHLIFHFVNWFWVGFFGQWHWMLCVSPVVDDGATDHVQLVCSLFHFFRKSEHVNLRVCSFPFLLFIRAFFAPLVLVWMFSFELESVT